MSQTKAQLIDPVDLSIVTADLADDAVTAAKLASNAVVNASVDASAAIAGTKISPNFGSQQVETTGAIVARGGLTALAAAEPQIVVQDSDSGNTGNAAETSIQFRDGGSSIQGQVGFHDVNSSNLFIDTSTTSQPINCRVGGSATQLLIDNGGIDVTGQITATDNLTITSVAPKIFLVDSDTNDDFSINGDGGTFRIKSETDSANRLVINSDGHTDIIGRLDAQAGLDVTGNIVGTANMTIDSGTLHVDSANNRVGINTTTPAGLLDLRDTSGASLTVRNTGTVASIGLAVGTATNQVVSRGLNTSTARPLVAMLGNTERVRVDNSGRVGIGTSNPNSTTLLHVSAPQTGSAGGTGITLSGWNGSAESRVQLMSYGIGNGTLAIRNTTSNTEVLRIDDSGNVGIGTTSPTANLHLKDGSGNTELKLQAGASTSNDVIAFLNSAGSTRGNITYDTDNDFVLFNVNTSERMRIASDGKVGIGTSNPGALLHIDSDSATAGIKISGDGNAFLDLDADSSIAGTQISFIDFKLAGTVEANIAVNESVSGNPLELNSATNHNVAIVNGGGNVGINTSSPVCKLHVAGGSGGGGVAEILRLDTAGNSNGDGSKINFTRAGTIRSDIFSVKNETSNNETDLAFSTTAAGTLGERMRITSSGKISLGASGPSSQLDPTSNGELYIDADPGSNYGSSNIRFRIDGIEMARITAGTHKNFLIGRTTTQANERLCIQNGSNQDVIFATQSQTAQNTRNVVLLNSYAQTDFANQIVFMDHQGGVRGTIRNNTSSTQYNTSSDYRLKENEVEISDSIERIKQLKPYRFNWKNRPNTTVDGFFAHEVQDLVEDCVSGTKDGVDSNGDPEYQEMDHSKLVPLLTAAIKSLVARVEILEAA